VGEVTDMDEMFQYALFNQALDSWDVEKVTTMSFMINHNSVFNKALESWDVGKVTSMCSIFWYASSFDQDLDAWNVCRVNYMSNMFQGANNFTQTPFWDLKDKYTDKMFPGSSGSANIATCNSTCLSTRHRSNTIPTLTILGASIGGILAARALVACAWVKFKNRHQELTASSSSNNSSSSNSSSVASRIRSATLLPGLPTRGSSYQRDRATLLLLPVSQRCTPRWW